MYKARYWRTSCSVEGRQVQLKDTVPVALSGGPLEPKKLNRYMSHQFDAQIQHVRCEYVGGWVSWLVAEDKISLWEADLAGVNSFLC